MSDSPRQFVAVTFKVGDARSYTYHHDGEPVMIGDRVLIPNRAGGQQSALVVALPTDEPSFPTKAIIGKAPPEAATDQPAVPQF